MPLLTGRQVLYFGDIGLFFFPMLEFHRRELLSGSLPLWNPHILFGTPFAGNPQTWLLYPSAAFLYLFSAPVAAGIIGAVHIAFAAIGMLLFLRRRGTSVSAAVFGAVAFAFGGALVSKMQFPNMTQAASYLPWLLWGLDRLLDRPGPADTALLGILIGLSLLAGHPQMFLMQFYLGLAWAVWRLWNMAPSLRKPAMLAVAAAFLVGIVLASAQLLPSIEMMRDSVRAKMTLGKANRFFLPLEMVFTVFVAPNYYGNPASGNFVAYGNYWESAAYMGILPIVLGLGAIWRRYRIVPEVRFWTGAFVVGFWMAVGRIGGLYAIAFFLVPGVNKFHDPARWLQVATFGLACLAAMGLDMAKGALVPGARRTLGVAVVLVAVIDILPMARILNPTTDPRVFSPPPTAVALQHLPKGRIYHADNDLVWRRYASYRTYLPGDTAHARAFLNALAPNVSQGYGFLDAEGYEPVRLRRIQPLRSELSTEIKRAERNGGAAPLAEAVGIRHVLSLGTEPLPIQGLGTVAKCGDVWIQELDGARPRAQLWTGWQSAKNDDKARERFLQEPDSLPLLVGRGERRLTHYPMAAEIVYEKPERLVVALPESHPGGLLLLQETAHAGWRARVDGRPADITTVDGLFRGVFVKPGELRVEFRYEPATVRIGFYLTLCGLGVVAAMLVGSLSRTRPVRQDEGGGDVPAQP